MSNYWEVSAILFQGTGRYWKIFWGTGDITEEPEFCLDGIDQVFKTHARNNQGEVIIINITHLRQDGNRFFVRSTTIPHWRRRSRIQVLPSLLDHFDRLPEQQKANGVALTASSVGTLGCCPYAVVSMFNCLGDYQYRFESFNYGAAIGEFVHWLHRTSFGQHKFKVECVRLRNGHVLDYLTSYDRIAGEKFIFQVNRHHAVGVEFVERDNEVHPVLHCALSPDQPLDLNLENFRASGGSLGYSGRIWRLLHFEETY